MTRNEVIVIAVRRMSKPMVVSSSNPDVAAAVRGTFARLGEA
jgi:hypothetical protein